MSNLKFKIQNGNAFDQNTYEPGDFPCVSASTERNGVVGFVKLQGGEKIFKSGSITIASEGQGSVCFCSVQSLDFVASGHGHVQVIEDYQLKDWSLEEKLILCSLIRSLRWKFYRGRTPQGRMTELPFTRDQIKKLAEKLKPEKIEIKNKTFNEALISKFKGRKISSIFSVISKSASINKTSSDSVGTIAVIGASESNNGIIGFVEKDILDLKDSVYSIPMITVASNGKPGVARVQDGKVNYVLAQNVLALKPKIPMTVDELLIVASLIENQSWRFNYSRTAGDGRISELVL